MLRRTVNGCRHLKYPDPGGFYTESITEDIATGILIQSCGYVSLALPDPLASGQTPDTFRDHIKQRTRWGRGVIVTLPFLVLIALSLIGIVRLILHFETGQTVSFLILIFWITRNLYFLVLSVFLADGRDGLERRQSL